MLTNIECPRCNGLGEVNATTPNMRSRYVRYDDLDPDDYTHPCPACEGAGSVDYDPEDEVEDWMR